MTTWTPVTQRTAWSRRCVPHRTSATQACTWKECPSCDNGRSCTPAVHKLLGRPLFVRRHTRQSRIARSASAAKPRRRKLRRDSDRDDEPKSLDEIINRTEQGSVTSSLGLKLRLQGWRVCVVRALTCAFVNVLESVDVLVPLFGRSCLEQTETCFQFVGVFRIPNAWVLLRFRNVRCRACLLYPLLVS